MKSEVRLTAPRSAESYELIVLIFSARKRLARRVEVEVPEALRLVRVDRPESVRAELGGRRVPCGVLVDLSLPLERRRELFTELGARWARPHALALARNSNPFDLGGLDAQASEYVYLDGAAETLEETLRIFYRSALGGTLFWIAARLALAHERGLDDRDLALFAAVAILQLRRAELSAHLGVSESSIQKRIRRLCSALQVERLASVTQISSSLNVGLMTPPNPGLLHTLERNARRLHTEHTVSPISHTA